MGKHVIWSDIGIDLDDWKDFLEEEHPEVTDEDEQYRLVMERNAEYLEDERLNLEQDVGGSIVLIADLGLWYGRREGYKVLDTSDLAAVLSPDSCDYHEWYVEDGEIKARAVHHDGTNCYIYRAIRPDLTDEEYDSVIYGVASVDEVMELTKPLGEYVSEVYGWPKE